MIAQHASTIRSFKLCPMLYRLQRLLCLAPVEETESLRMGTNWHKCLEILTGTGGQDALIEHLNQVYEDRPASVEPEKWETERTILLYSALGWQWYWQDDNVETLAREISFKREVRPGYTRQGRIDRIVRHNLLQIGEYKSTSKAIESDAPYWDALNLDTQITLYIIEARHMQLVGDLEKYGIKPTDPLISGVLYDVWRKPTIRPKKLTQADSKKFLVEKLYFDESFDVECWIDAAAHGKIQVDGVAANFTPGVEPKPTRKNPNPTRPIAIHETPEMFGARLLHDIRNDPGRYFVRKEIARTDKDLQRFDEEYYKIARLANLMDKQNLWYVNEYQCHATYRCPFTQICQHGLNVEDGNIPDGFKRVSDEW